MTDQELLSIMVLEDFTFDPFIVRGWSLDEIRNVARQYTVDELDDIINNCQTEISRLDRQMEILKENVAVLGNLVKKKNTMKTHNVAFVEETTTSYKSEKTNKRYNKRVFKISVVETSKDEKMPKKVVHNEFTKTNNIGPLVKTINLLAEQYDFSKVVFVNIEAPTEIKGFKVAEKHFEPCSAYNIMTGEGLEEIDESFMVDYAFVVPSV